jgi:hypothetical protein
MERKRIGRPPKGDRRMIAARLPRPLADAVGEYAAHNGVTVNDLIGELLAERVGMPYMDQEALPLDKSA